MCGKLICPFSLLGFNVLHFFCVCVLSYYSHGFKPFDFQLVDGLNKIHRVWNKV